MKKMVSMLLTLIMLFAMTACGANTGRPQDSTDEEKTSSADAPDEQPAQTYPTGMFMLKYLGNEAGEYVPESNEYLDGMNRPVTLLGMMWEDNTTIRCEIGEDGIGTYTAGNDEPVVMDFNTDEPGMLLFGGSRQLSTDTGEYEVAESLVPYRYDEETGEFWFEGEPGFWYVMKPCSQEALDLVFEGKGGSVPVSEAEAGDLVCMGVYQQTADSAENEPIYWRVLAKEGDRILLLSDKLLDSFSYNYNPDQEVMTDVTWENCSLREFLNQPEGFLSMFTEEEIARMQTTHLENKAANEELMAQWGFLEDQGEKTYSDLSIQDRPDDPDTDDRVFLLSYQEVLQYFGEPTEEAGDGEYPFTVLKVNPAWTAFVTDAVTTGYYDNETRGGAWLTRTLCNSHSDEDMVVYISSTGQVFDYFTYVPLFIRPAVWVSTDR